MDEHLFSEFALAHPTFGLCTYPTETFHFTYHPFNGPEMCAVDNFQRSIFGNSQSPEKFTGKPKIVSLPTSSQESVQQKYTHTFTFKLCNIYEINSTDQYLRSCCPVTNNDSILVLLLQHEDDNFLKLTVENRLQEIRSKKMVEQLSSGMEGGDCHVYPTRRQCGYIQGCSARLGAVST